jgi:hypothetical protein
MQDAEGRMQKAMRRLFFSAFCLLPSAFSCAPAPEPQATIIPAQAPAPELSTIIIPIHASLAPLLPELERQIPKTLQSPSYQVDPQHHFAAKYQIAREPISVNMIGAGLHVSTTVHYALEGCPVINGVIRNACISCGFGEPMRDVIVALQSRLDWSDAWSLRSRTAMQPLEFPNRCTVTFLGIDLTDRKLRPILEEQLALATKMIDASAPKLASIKPLAQQVWTALQQPYPIATNTWLVLEPADVALAPIHGTGLNVASAIELRARTRVIVGPKPAVSQKPLPALRTSLTDSAQCPVPCAQESLPRAPGTGHRPLLDVPARTVDGAPQSALRVAFDVELPYAEASRIVTEQFGKQTYNLGGGAMLAIDSIRLSAGKNGKTNIEASIDYHGGGLRRYAGLVYLDGVPSFDAASGSVVISDVEYSIDPKRHNPFLRAANRMAHDRVRTQLRAGAKWPIGSSIAVMKGEIERGMTRKLASNVMLRGHVDSIDPVSVTVSPVGLTIRAAAVGSAVVELK